MGGLESQRLPGLAVALPFALPLGLPLGLLLAFPPPLLPLDFFFGRSSSSESSILPLSRPSSMRFLSAGTVRQPPTSTGRREQPRLTLGRFPFELIPIITLAAAVTSVVEVRAAGIIIAGIVI
jgi:hypothetical protein